MKAINKRVILSKDKDNHKEIHKVDDNHVLYIPIHLENNLRERNENIAYVEAVDELNELNLKVGDRVMTHHFILQGDIGKESDYRTKGEDKELFGADYNDLFFKIPTDKWDDVECLGDYILAEKLTYTEIKGFETLETEYNNRAVIVSFPDKYNGKLTKGAEVLTVPYALGYEIKLGKEKKSKIRYNEIIAIINEGDFSPLEGWIMVKRDKSKESVIKLLNDPPKPSTGVVVKSACEGIVTGDRIQFSGANHTSIDKDGEEYLFMKESHVYFKIVQYG